MAHKIPLSLWDQEDYQENLRLLQGAADELLGHMKGHSFSFRRKITDARGDFSQEKLRGLVEEMLSLWEDDQRASQPAALGPGFQERRELYGLYLYLVMRCSLEKGAYSNTRGGAELKERTDFAFLLRQARQLFQDWYAVPGLDGSLCNEVYGGYDHHFGFHIYYALNDPDVSNGCSNPGNNYSLTPDWKVRWTPADLVPHPQAEETEETEEAGEAPPPDDEDDLNEKDYDDCDLFVAVALEEDDDLDDDWDFLEPDYAYLRRLGAVGERAQELMLLATHFKCPEEYCSACNRFVELFAKAPPEVLHSFCADLEKMVDLYLIKRDIPPLMDKDKTLNVYNSLCDGALRQAARYGRGVQWNGL